jgi:alkylhydroperoxidase/carboxymuconolactone decarboxylase family protein YurZ
MSSDDNDSARTPGTEKGIEIITHLAHYAFGPIAFGAFRVLEEVAA